MIRRVLGLALLLVLMVASPAAAHDDEGRLSLVATTPGSATEVTFEVDLVYAGDGEAVSDGALTAVAVSAAGTRLEPVAMGRVAALPGHYRVQLEFPSSGSWSVSFNSLTPRATLMVPYVVAAPATTATTTTAAPATIELRPVQTDRTSNRAWVGGVIVVGVAIVAAAAAVVLRRRRTPT